MENKPIYLKQPLIAVWCVLICSIFLLHQALNAQSGEIRTNDQHLTAQQVDSVRLKELMDLSSQLYFVNPDSALIVSQQAIDLSLELDSKEDLGYAYKNLGLAYYMKADWARTMDAWEKSLSTFVEIDSKVGISNLQNNIGAVYQTKGDDPKAREYFLMAVKNAEATADTMRIASAYLNIGTTYLIEENTLDQALDAYSIALDMFRKINYDRGVATAAINIGEVYLTMEQPEKALNYLEESVDLFKKLGMDYSLSLMLLGQAFLDMDQEKLAEEYYIEVIRISSANETKMEQAKAYNALANLQLDQKRLELSIDNFNNALDLSLTTEILREQKDAYDGLASAYAQLGEYENAFAYQKLHEMLSDSILDIESARNAENLQESLQFKYGVANWEEAIALYSTQNELAQVQIDRDAKAKTILFITLGLFLVVIGGVAYQYIYSRKSNKRLAAEQEKSEKILLNILPEETAQELKENGQIKAKQFEQITVLFTDFKEFSLVAEGISASELVESVDFYFKAFDEIIERHNLEKIKTIGDSYMCAGGIPTENESHAEDACNAAIEIMEFVKEVKNKPPQGIQTFEVRIGLNSGPVVAGVVGTKKFAYDIWGNTVNIAARMESNSVPGKINVSENTYQLLRDKQPFTYRGEIEVKNKQLLKMYFLEVESAVAV